MAVALVILGCGSPASPAHAPWPDDLGAPPASPPAPTAAVRLPNDPPWDARAILSGTHLVAQRAPSQHFGGDAEGEIMANAAARPYPALGPKHVLPPGATLLQRHFDRRTGQIGATFVMVKRPAGYDRNGGDWEYGILGSDGSVESHGRLALCGRCHAEAPHDHLFGVGRRPRAPASQTLQGP
jgi:hypothetical protein